MAPAPERPTCVEPSAIDIERDVTFIPDIRGPALLVHWRHIPIGFIRPLKRTPKSHKTLSADSRAEIRKAYKSFIGKWHAPLFGGGYFDTKEDAARHIIARTLNFSADMPLIKAAMREDHAEVDRLLAEMRAQVVLGSDDA